LSKEPDSAHQSDAIDTAIRAANKLESAAKSNADILVSEAYAEAARVKVLAEQAASDLVASTARQLVKDAEAKKSLDLSLRTALHEFFDASDSNGVKQFLNQNRIPLICESIRNIQAILDKHAASMKSISADIRLLKWIIFSAIGIILAGFCGITWMAIVHFLKVVP